MLRRAGVEDADMLIAVTPHDEVNMVACQVCYTMFQTERKIARIREDAFHAGSSLFSSEHMPIDFVINPERVVTDQIRELLQRPGALQVLDFANGRVKLVATRVRENGPLVGSELRRLRRRLPKADTRVAAIFRRGRAILPEGDTMIEADDEIFFIAATEHIKAVMAALREAERPTSASSSQAAGASARISRGRSSPISPSRSSNTTAAAPTISRNAWSPPW